MLRARAASPIALLLLVLTACSGGDAGTDTGAAGATAGTEAMALTVPVSTTELGAAGLLEDVELDWAVSADNGIVAGAGTATDRYGEYVRAALAPDAAVRSYDPAGPWAEVLDWLDPAYVQQAVSDGARFFVEEWLDSATRWDDSAEAWAALNAATGELMGRVGQDVRVWAADGEDAHRFFDLDDWREGLGVRPVAYPTDQPRFVVSDLAVTDMGVYAPFAEDGDLENVGLSVTFEATTHELVTTADGGVALMRQWMTLTLGSMQSTGNVEQLWWNSNYDVQRRLTGGMAALPVLETTPAVPAGWEPTTVGGLTFAVPAGGAVQDDGDGWLGYPFGTSTQAGDDAMFWVHGPRDIGADETPGSWIALEGFDNYGLTIPGATVAAAEIGHDMWGQYRVRIFLHGTTGGDLVAYRVEWDTTPERAEAELRQVAGTLSVTSS